MVPAIAVFVESFVIRVRNPFTIRSIVAAMLVSPALLIAQSTQPPRQPLQLPDPTPRPPDLQRSYGGDPVQREIQQRADALRNAQRRDLVVRAANAAVLLAQELKGEVLARDTGAPLHTSADKAEAIEKMAKIVKERVKAQ